MLKAKLEGKVVIFLIKIYTGKTNVDNVDV